MTLQIFPRLFDPNRPAPKPKRRRKPKPTTRTRCDVQPVKATKRRAVGGAR